MHKIRLVNIVLTLLLALGVSQAYSQTDAGKRRISGAVTDIGGSNLIGVNVLEKGTMNGTATDIQGKFSLLVDDNATLVVSFLGYATQEIAVGSQTNLLIRLEEDDKLIDEIVVVGYGTQKKASVTGSVAAVTNKEIITTKSQNVQNMLAGKMAGLRVVQRTSEPGNFNNDFQIRGMGSPLIIIDGVPRDNMTRLDGNDIENISILKDGAAAIYGVQGGSGVVLITTKQGKKGQLELDYSGNFGWQFTGKTPKTIDAIDFMTLSNEKERHDVNRDQTSQSTYTDAMFEQYRNGTLRSTDWYKEVMRSSAPQMQHNISARGGSDAMRYFISFGQQSQESFLKSDDKDYKRYTVRSNVSSNITKRLKVDLNISGTSEQTDSPYEDFYQIVRSYWRMKPTESVYFNDVVGNFTNSSIDGNRNPAALMEKDVVGYNMNRNKWLQTSGTITYDIPYVQGLQAKAMYSYDYYISDNKINKRAYKLYDQTNPDGLPFGNKGELKRENFSRQNQLWNISLDYNRTFNNAHDVSAMFLLEESIRESDNFYAMRYLSLPLDQLFSGDEEGQIGSMNNSDIYEYSRRSWVGRVNYSYKSKYLAEFAFRYDSSSRYPKNKRWAFFPSFSLGWRISEEDFWKNSQVLSKVNYIKLRGSYGEMGLDDASERFQHLTGYNYPSLSGFDASKLPGGSVFDGVFVNGLTPTGIPNRNITWYTVKTVNIGFDAEAWNGLLGVTFDLFQRLEEDQMATRTASIPGLLGASLPQENLNSDYRRGFDLEVTHRNHIGELSYNAKAILSFVRRKYKYRERATEGNSYNNWRNEQNDRWANIWWGYGTDGRYNNWSDIYNSKTQIGVGTLPGDYAYEDWNGDGIIDGLDEHPIYYSGNEPMLTYGLNVGLEYKGLDFNMLWQGGAMIYVSYSGQLHEPLWGGGSALKQFMDRWRPADTNADPYDPNTQWISGNYAYTGTQPRTNSFFNMENGAYIRLKSIELGYTLPANWIRHIGLKNVRVYANAYNLFTITKVKNMDPEIASGDGYIYPLNKTFSLGLNIKF